MLPSYRPVITSLPEYRPGREHKKNIKLSSNENILGPSPKAFQSFKQAASQLHIYPDNDCYQLRQKLANHFNLSPEHFIIGNGSNDIMLMSASAFLNAGDHVLIAKHTFSQYEFYTRLFAAVPQRIPMHNYAYDLDATLDAITSKTKMIFLCSPNNPTGMLIQNIRHFLERIPPSILVIVDHAYIEYAQLSFATDDTSLLVPDFPHLLVLHTFSKIYGLAALRIGYGIASPQLISILYKTKAPFNVNMPAQQAAIQALSDTAFIQQSLEINRTGKKFLLDMCHQYDIESFPSEGNFICMHTPIPADKCCAHFQTAGMMIRSLQSFGMPNYIRVTIGTETHMRIFKNIWENIFIHT